uniref:Uncharacterized protein MANES_09G114500 n=1 Tax=Rhizophora mucronata TaxID=61149 RepID=A0A2P2K9D0_RHIMU
MDIIPTILDHRLQKRQSKELHFRALVQQPFLYCFHNIFCLPEQFSTH